MFYTNCSSRLKFSKSMSVSLNFADICIYSPLSSGQHSAIIALYTACCYIKHTTTSKLITDDIFRYMARGVELESGFFEYFAADRYNLSK